MIAVVVPVYGHPVLVFDAIQSLATPNAANADAAIVIVDDGCPNIETQFAGLGLAALDPRITYLRGLNRGLSGARNRGIEHVLAEMPAAEAIYFLDADNMLSDWSLPRMHAVLGEQPDYDWFYPDIRMFGLEWEATYAGAFTPLIESLMNVCEAGSLVRRRVFESGLRFDEQLRMGFEDWDFWLSASERGFRGLHFESSGFRYRKRPESMLANSARNQAEIRKRLEERHPWMVDLKWIIAAEHRAVPRYAIYLTDLDVVRLTSSAEMTTEELSWSAYVTRFWAALRAPKARHAGAILLITTSHAVTILATTGLLSCVLYDLEVRLRDCNIATVALAREGDHEIAIGAPEFARGAAPAIAAIGMATLRTVIHDPADTWISSVSQPAPLPRLSHRRFVLPRQMPYIEPIGDMLGELVTTSLALRRVRFAAGPGLPADDCALGTPDRALINNLLRARFGGGVIPPALAGTGPELAFVLPRFALGGVERVTLFVARALRRRGYTVSLVLLKSRSLHRVAAFADAFDRVFFLDNEEFESWSGPSYFGTALSRWSVAGEQANELNLLSAFDVVIGCHAGDVMGLLGSLQTRNVVTGAYLHLFDATESGRACGHPHLALAFEHALDLFVGCSQGIGVWMHGLGVPAAKIVTVPNAAGLDISAAAVTASLRRRADRDDGRLHVLYVGRLDPQKGIDRVQAICASLRRRPDMDIRVIGRAVIAENSTLPGLADLIEPPVYGPDLEAAYAWADILILPSAWEGLPLTVIEAMQLGVVPIVARSGAIAEVIDHEHNGFIVSQHGCVPETLQCIASLAADRTMLHAMMHAASASAGARNWEDAVGALDTAMRHAIAQRQARASPAPDG